MAREIQTNVCIIGGGISAAMLAERLSETTSASILVIEAGNRLFNLEERFENRRRLMEYGENPWPGNTIPGMTATGIQSRAMSVGGLAMHWGGTCPRYAPEDFQIHSKFGIGYDWPITYDDLEPFYVEAERRIGVAGEPGPDAMDPRSADYPMAPLPISYNLGLLKQWAEKSDIAFWRNPVSKNSEPYHGRNICTRCDTCSICPTGAKYSPDFTFQALLQNERIELLDRTVVRRLHPADSGSGISMAEALDRDQPDEAIEIRADQFIVASGYAWSSHLLLLSQSPRYPTGLANSSGLVGKYMTGHRPVDTTVELPIRLFPGVYRADSLLSKQFETHTPTDRYMRHDLRIWESASGRAPRLRDDSGEVLLGDGLMQDWRSRTETGTARMRSYYDVIPARESALTLDSNRTSPWGDPLPRIDFADSDWSTSLRESTETQIRSNFDNMLRAGGGRQLSIRVDEVYDHPGGGCRMGLDPDDSVVDPWGRTHDHDNLWVVGAPNLVSAGCNNGTLSFAALTLRSASKIAESLPNTAPKTD